MKATGWRVVGHGMPVRIRKDSQWDVPEPELVLVVNHELEIVGHCLTMICPPDRGRESALFATEKDL
jgi:fumarylacetoacetate (FAA) hydrolase family protein